MSSSKISPNRASLTCDVVIPYCRANLPWLRTSVESIISQVGVQCYVHLIADGFNLKDDPALIFKDHPYVHLYRNTDNIGPYRTLNRIVNQLKTDFIAVQDSDDIALPHRMQVSLQTLVKTGVDYFSGAMRQFLQWEYANERDLRRILEYQPVLYPGKTNEHHQLGWFINGTFTIRKAAFLKLNGWAPMLGGADTEFSMRAPFGNLTAIMSREIIALRRVHRHSLSHGTHGLGTADREKWRTDGLRNWAEMKAGADPASYGGIPAERAHAHKTIKLNKLSTSLYWESRKTARYYQDVRRLVKKWSPGPGTLLDVGGGVTAGARYLEWFPEYKREVVETQGGHWNMPEVELHLGDFMQWEDPRKFDVVLCLQVLEHLQDPAAFCRKLFETGKTVVLSVPYKWAAGLNKSHIHDPVDEIKLRAWTGRDPIERLISTELSGVQRLVAVYR